MNENTDCVVTVTDLADQHAFTEALASADILTNGTKVGMKPLENESLIGDVSCSALNCWSPNVFIIRI